MGENVSTLKGIQFVVAQPELVVYDPEEAKLTEARRKSFDRLEDIGVISRVHNASGEELMVLENTDIFTKDRYSGYDWATGRKIERRSRDLLSDVCRPISESGEWGDSSKTKTLFFLFRDTKVITREEADGVSLKDGGNWKYKEVPAKSFFYLPESREDAFDLEKARNAEYYFLLPQICKRWDGFYPTKRERFGSGLSQMEAMVPAMISMGRGARNGEGVLMVDTEVGKEGKRQPISHQWIETNFHTNIFPEKGYSEAILREQGAGLLEKGLLTTADFRENRKRGERDVVAKNGTWFDSGIRYYLGKGLRGCRVERIAGDLVTVIDQEGKVRKSFNPNLDEKTRAELTLSIVSNRGTLVTNAPAMVMKMAEIESGKVQIIRTNKEGERRMEEEDLAAIIPRLTEFLNLTGINKEARRYFRTEELVGVLKQYEELREESRGAYAELIKNYGFTALRFLSDRYVHGGLPEGALQLSKTERETTERLLENYVRATDSLEGLGEIFPTGDDTAKYYMERMSASFKYGIEGLIKAGVAVDLDQAADQMELLAGAFGALRDLWTKERSWNKDNVYSTVDRERGGSKSVTVIYRSEEGGSTLRMTFTPEKIEGKKGKGASQARWGVVYRDSRGREMGFRLDLDEYGASLDLGQKESNLHKILEGIGYDYHIQEVINKAVFRRPEIFAGFVKSVAAVSGVEITNRKQ